jgi:hypothetical protein
MTQSELILKIAELDADISRQRIRVEEATAKLTALELRRRDLERHCTHVDGLNNSLFESRGGIPTCSLCGLDDR